MNENISRVVISDVDGVLNTGQFLYDENGKRYKVFGPHDADGVKILKNLGFIVEFISADKRGFSITKARIDDMGCKVTLVSETERLEWIDRHFGLSKIIYIGDGYHDAPILSKAGIGISPCNARIEAKAAADYVTEAKSGEGAFLDAALIIKAIFEE